MSSLHLPCSFFMPSLGFLGFRSGNCIAFFRVLKSCDTPPTLFPGTRLVADLYEQSVSAKYIYCVQDYSRFCVVVLERLWREF